MTTPVSAWRTAAEGYRHNGLFSDFTIVCQGTQFKVHRCFVAALSKWFEKCCSGTFAEATERKVELFDDNLDAVKAMVDFCYTLDYEDLPEATISSTHFGMTPNHFGGPFGAQAPSRTIESYQSAVELNARVYATADKYDMPTLKIVALQKFRAQLAQIHSNAQAMASTAKIVYYGIPLQPSDRDLHNVVVDAWLHSGKCIHEAGNDDGHSVYRGLLEDAPDFVLEVFTRLMGDDSNKTNNYCPKCDMSQHRGRGRRRG